MRWAALPKQRIGGSIEVDAEFDCQPQAIALRAQGLQGGNATSRLCSLAVSAHDVEPLALEEPLQAQSMGQDYSTRQAQLRHGVAHLIIKCTNVAHSQRDRQSKALFSAEQETLVLTAPAVPMPIVIYPRTVLT